MFSDHDNPTRRIPVQQLLRRRIADNVAKDANQPAGFASQTGAEKSASEVKHDGHACAAAPQADGDRAKAPAGTRRRCCRASGERTLRRAPMRRDSAMRRARDAARSEVDAEAARAAEEAAGSEEMSKLMEQYDEKQEARVAERNYRSDSGGVHRTRRGGGHRAEDRRADPRGGIFARRRFLVRSRTARLKCSAPASAKKAS